MVAMGFQSSYLNSPLGLKIKFGSQNLLGLQRKIRAGQETGNTQKKFTAYHMSDSI